MKAFGLIILLTLSGNCYGQELSSLYRGIPSDSLHGSHLLEFQNDSLLEISTPPRHMSQQFYMTFSYKKTDTTLIIYKTDWSHGDSLSLAGNRLTQFTRPVRLTVDKQTLIDENNELIYVLNKNLKKGIKLTYIVDNEVYLQDSGLNNSYGLLEKTPKENKKLTKKLASIKDDLDQYDIQVFEGLSAYRKFGYEGIFGVIVISKKPDVPFPDKH